MDAPFDRDTPGGWAVLDPSTLDLHWPSTIANGPIDSPGAHRTLDVQR